MEVLECIKSRRAVRKYLVKEVPWELIANILDAGRHAPSSGNLQNWKFIVALDKDKREAVAKACLNQLWIALAPVHIIIISEPEKGERSYGDRGKTLYNIQNCAAAAENMLLEAHNLGLGSCWVGAFNPVEIRRIFGMPEEVEPQIVLTFGFPNENPAHPSKLPLEAVTYFGGWRAKIKDLAAYAGFYSVHVQKAVGKGKEAAKEASITFKEKAKLWKDKIYRKLTEKRK